MLTDGEVKDPDAIIEFISKNCSHTKVHTFGIGDEASQYLINESAKAEKGKAYLIPDGDVTLNAKVISALKYACKESFKLINVDWGTP